MFAYWMTCGMNPSNGVSVDRSAVENPCSFSGGSCYLRGIRPCQKFGSPAISTSDSLWPSCMCYHTRDGALLTPCQALPTCVAKVVTSSTSPIFRENFRSSGIFPPFNPRITPSILTSLLITITSQKRCFGSLHRFRKGGDDLDLAERFVQYFVGARDLQFA